MKGVKENSHIAFQLKKIVTSLTCKRALIVSIGFVINVVVNPASTPDTLCKNRSEVFTGNLFSSCPKYLEIKYTYIFITMLVSII